ncbi:MAG: hypothetical protein GF330_12335 [Candidatus Eisenbacteria bacterium]|nr:hypothetical protein [Candidatus Eisenbacteria bacterium]
MACGSRGDPGRGSIEERNRLGATTMQRREMIVAATLMTLVTGAAQGAGFQAYFEQGAATMGRAAATVAHPCGADALFFNPAAAMQLDGTHCAATINGLVQMTQYIPHAQDTEPRATDPRLGREPTTIPAAYLAHRMGRRWSLGLALNTPYGAATEWDSGWAGRYYADYTNLRSLYAAPTLAWALGDRVSLGAALLAVWGDARIERAINAPLVFASAAPDLATAYMSGAFSAPNDVQMQLSGDDWSWGGRLGCHLRLGQRWQAGLCYQSAVRLDLRGRATYDRPSYADADFAHEPGTGATATQLAAALFPDTDIETALTLPPTVAAGLAYEPSPRLLLETNLMWTGWSHYDSLSVTYGSLAGEQNVRSGTPKLWEDSFTLRIGAAYTLSERLTYRAGYAFDQSPIPDATRDPSLPGSDRHDLTTGIGYRLGDWQLDLAYLYAMLADSPSEQRSAMSGDLVGGYQGSAHVFAAGVARSFD